MIRLITAFSLLFASIAQADVYDVKILRIIDGDTIVVEAPFLPSPLKPELAIRVYGVDTPEKSWRGKCEYERDLGEMASMYTETLIENTTKHEIDLIKWDKFGGRVLGDVILDGQSLRQALIDNGYAREYFGEKKESWCPDEVE